MFRPEGFWIRKNLWKVKWLPGGLQIWPASWGLCSPTVLQVPRSTKAAHISRYQSWARTCCLGCPVWCRVLNSSIFDASVVGAPHYRHYQVVLQKQLNFQAFLLKSQTPASDTALCLECSIQGCYLDFYLLEKFLNNIVCAPPQQSKGRQRFFWCCACC